DGDNAEQDEGGGRGYEVIERVCGVDGPERANGAGGGENAWYMGRGDGRDGKPAFGTAEPFACDNERQREERRQSDAHAGTEDALLDRVPHKQQGTKCKRKAPEPDGPARAELLLQGGALQRGRTRRHLRDRGRDRGRCGGLHWSLKLGRGASRVGDLRRLGLLASGGC